MPDAAKRQESALDILIDRVEYAQKIGLPVEVTEDVQRLIAVALVDLAKEVRSHA